MEYLSVAGGIIGLVAYAFLVVALVRTGTEQSFAAFFLWTLLDVIAAVTTIIADGNYWLALANAVGSATITTILVMKKQVSWSWVESMTAVMVVICLVVWYTSGERAGIIASSIAVVLASVPQMVDTFKKPASTPTRVYGIFLVANTMSFVGGSAWTIEERFYAAGGIFLCAVIFVFSLRGAKATSA